MRAPTVRSVRQGVIALAVAAIAIVIVAQYARLVARNVQFVAQLHAMQDGVQHLEARKLIQEQEIRRLSTAEGVMPEIHQHLWMVRPDEELIYVRR